MLYIFALWCHMLPTDDFWSNNSLCLLPGRRGTTFLCSKGRESSFRSCSESCSTRRRKAHSTEGTPDEEISRNQLVPPSFEFYLIKQSLLSSIIWLWYFGSEEMQFEGHWHWCGALSIDGEKLSSKSFPVALDYAISNLNLLQCVEERLRGFISNTIRFSKQVWYFKFIQLSFPNKLSEILNSLYVFSLFVEGWCWKVKASFLSVILRCSQSYYEGEPRS